MAAYPSLDQYNDAVQSPRLAFTDPLLQSGAVDKGGLGLPLALGGGFALTYGVTSGGRKYAVRCFHRDAAHLERRYAQIDSAIASDNSGAFVGFEYQTKGILVNGSHYPIVRMEWAAGDTLGSYLENNHTDAAKIRNLRLRFRKLERLLRSKRLAHGDIQNGNLIVNGSLKLIDYDGMFVPSMAVGKGTEIGHRHFQHPGRNEKSFGPDMDRFSFILVDLSLRLIETEASLFRKHSNGENILFSASDLRDPLQSVVFADAIKVEGCRLDVANFIQVCRAPLEKVPTLEDFLADQNIPTVGIEGQEALPKEPLARPAYVGAYDIVDARKYDDVRAFVGQRVEMIGWITEVRKAQTRHGKPYIFLNFGSWKGRIAKISIWSEGLAKLKSEPDSSWNHKWVSVTGLVDPPYTNRRYGYTHLSITVTEANQLHVITEAEAKRRLRGVGSGTPTQPERPEKGPNQGILDDIGNPGNGGRPPPTRPTNKDILKDIKRRPAHIPHATSKGPSAPAPTPRQQDSSGHGCLPWIIVGGLIILALNFLG